MSLPKGFDDRDIATPRYPLRRAWLEPQTKVALIVSGALVVSALIAGGRYTAVPAGSGPAMFRVDRLTGAVRVCYTNGCRDLALLPPPADPWAPKTD